MASLDQVRADGKLRNTLVKNSLMTKSAGLLFVLAVDQFKEKPNKKKAIAIFDIFIKDGGLWKESL
jgi:hypothetical protein